MLRDENLNGSFKPNHRAAAPQIPNRGLSENPLDYGPSGRMEKRLPIIVVVRLASAASVAADDEKTFTDNISPHGARIFSRQAWKPGDVVRVTPLNQDAASASVVYTERLPDNRFSIGVQFQDHTVAWSVLQRYDGLLR
jgi:hypothetical protein